MESYSALCARARALFVEANEQGLRGASDLVEFWQQMVAISGDMAMGSSVRGLRFERTDFTDETWKIVAAMLKPFESLDCAVKHKDGNKIAAFVLDPQKFDEAKVSAMTERRKKPRVKAEPMPAPAPEPVVRLVPTKPARNKVAPSIAVIVDLANLTKHVDQGTGRKVLDPQRMDWQRFRQQLTASDNGTQKVDRLIICVSEHYYANNYAALSAAQRAGFEIVKMYGDKEADPVVTSEITRVVLDHLILHYNDRIPTLVLASGDKDFTSIVQTLRPFVASEGLSLSLRVVTWRDGLSRELYCACSELLYVDDILEYIDPYGSQLRSGFRLRRV